MANTVTVRFLGNASALNTVIGRVDQRLSGLARLVNRISIAMAVAVTTAIGSAVSSFVDFDDKMTQSLAIMGNVSDALQKDMSAAAIEVGKTTRLSASEAAESYFFLASAGLDAKESLEAMPAVAAFAQAGMFDMALATDLVTDAQSALGLKSEDSAQNLENLVRVSDALVKSNTLANASVQQFSEALTADAASSLKIVNKDMEEGLAVLAAWADQGTKGAAAGTALGIVLRDLKTKSVENADAFAKAGVSVFDSAGEMRNMADIVEDLENAFGDLSSEDAQKGLLDLGFSDRNLKRLQQLFGTSDAIREYEAELRNAGGTTEEVAKKQLNSISAQFDLLKGTIEGVALTTVERFKPGIISALQGVRDWWDRNGQAITDWFDKAIGRIVTWWESTGRGALLTIISAFGRFGQLVLAALRVISDWWDQNGATVMATIRSAVEGVFKFLSEWWAENGDGLITFLKDFGTAAEEAFTIISEWWGENGAEVTNGLRALGSAVGWIIRKLGEWKVISNAVKIILESFKIAIDVVEFAILVAAEAVVLFIESAITLGEILGTAGVIIFETAELIGTKLGQAIQWSWDKLKGFGSWIKNSWGGVVASYHNSLGTIDRAWANVTGSFNDFKSDVILGMGVVKTFISNTWNTIKGFFTQSFSVSSSLFNGIRDAFRSALNWVIDRWNSLTFTIPSFQFLGQTVGGNSISTPNIPRLAQGGVANANDPFLAIIGDNKTQREVVAPEDMLRQVFSEELARNAGSSGANGMVVNIETINAANMDAKDLADEIFWNAMMGA